MKGFTCHSLGSTAVCMDRDYRSLVVPHRPLVDQRRLINKTKYIRLGEALSTSGSVRRSSHVPSRKKDDQENKVPKELTPPTISHGAFQVVVMRVSLHCQGCAGKLKKHLSKMEGVTSFSIDLESKRVTVMGHLSPSCLLGSISKVKRAELWPNCGAP